MIDPGEIDIPSIPLEWLAVVLVPVVTLIGYLWQHGGSLATRRRRLHQELDIFEKLPEGSKDAFEGYIDREVLVYLYLADEPWPKRVVRSAAGYALFGAVVGAVLYFFTDYRTELDSWPEIARVGVRVLVLCIALGALSASLAAWRFRRWFRIYQETRTSGRDDDSVAEIEGSDDEPSAAP